MADQPAVAAPRRVLALGVPPPSPRPLSACSPNSTRPSFLWRQYPKAGCCAQTICSPRCNCGHDLYRRSRQHRRHPAMLAHAATALGGIDLAFLATVSSAISRRRKKLCRCRSHSAHQLSCRPFAGDLVASYLSLSAAAPSRHLLGRRDRGRKSNYVYGASKGGLDIFLDGRAQPHRPRRRARSHHQAGICRTPMTAHLPKNALFAEPARVAKHIVRPSRNAKTWPTSRLLGPDHAGGSQHSQAHFQENEYVGGGALIAREICIGYSFDNIYSVS